MRKSAIKIHPNEWKNSDLGNDNKGMIKTLLGFLYFVVLISSLIELFTT